MAARKVKRRPAPKRASKSKKVAAASPGSASTSTAAAATRPGSAPKSEKVAARSGSATKSKAAAAARSGSATKSKKVASPGSASKSKKVASPGSATKSEAAAPASPEQIVEAALQKVPARSPVFEVATAPAARLVRALRTAGVVLTPAELEQQLVDAGMVLQGSARARASARRTVLEAIAKDVSAALKASQPVFWVRTEAGPPVILGEDRRLDLSALPGLGLGVDGALLHVGGLDGVPSLVAAILAAWSRGPGRRALASKVMLVTGGAADPADPRDWQAALQGIADSAGRAVRVRHLPAGIGRWMCASASLGRIDTVLPGGRTARTTVERLYARRPGRLPAPLGVDVHLRPEANGRPRPVSEGTPAKRCYRLDPA